MSDAYSVRREKWLPVRCCCTPRKVFGFLRVPEMEATCLTLLDRSGMQHRVQVRPITEGISSIDGEIEFHVERAIYSEERPLEFWRTIPGFLEVA